MYKLKLFLFLFSLIYSISYADLITNRSHIGPTYSPPLFVGDQLYILSSSGVLIKSNFEQTKIEKLFTLSKNSMGGMTRDGDFFYFGEGAHEDQNVNLYKFNYKTNKLDQKVKFSGHIERPPLVHKGAIYVGLGMGGISKVNVSDMKVQWTIKKIKAGKLHVDNTPIFHHGMICFTSIYDYKGIVCLDAKNGTEKFDLSLTLNPKGEIGQVDNFLYGLATDANVAQNNFSIKSHFYVVDLSKKKLNFSKELRGYNFFKMPVVEKNKVLTSLSTGDIILMSLENGRVEYISEFPEPFISSPFVFKEQYCVAGIMGKISCYKKDKDHYAVSFEDRRMENFVGRINNGQDRIYIPSRMGYYILK